MLFRGLVVLVFAANRAVDDDEVRVVFSRNLCYSGHVDVLDVALAAQPGPCFVVYAPFGAHPTAIEPKNVDVAVIMGEFSYLSMGELFVFLETLRHDGRVIVDVAVRGGPFVCPIVIAVPVGLGEIEACPEALFTKGLDHRTSDVSFGILGEGTRRVDGGVGGLLGIEHAEAVMVLRGENDVFHARAFGGFGPFRWVEMLWVNGLVKILVISLVLVIIRAIAINPRLVADGPLLHHFPLGVDAPVHHKTEFQVLPLADAVGDDGVGFGLLVGLGEREACKAKKSHQKDIFFHRKKILLGKSRKFP